MRTELQVFSTPAVQENDFTVGPMVLLGASMDVGVGSLAAELRYRELGADIGDWKGVAESALSSFGLSVGYLIAF